MYIKQKIILKRVGSVERGIAAVFSIAAFGNAESCSYLLVEALSSSQSFNAVYQYFIKIPQTMKYF